MLAVDIAPTFGSEKKNPLGILGHTKFLSKIRVLLAVQQERLLIFSIRDGPWLFLLSSTPGLRKGEKKWRMTAKNKWLL